MTISEIFSYQITHQIILAAVTGVPAFMYGRWHEAKKSTRVSDTASYRHLKNNLPNFPQIRYFFCETNLADQFSVTTFNVFGQAFNDVASNPEKNFLDKSLQTRVIKITELHKKMAHIIAIKTFPIPDGSRLQTIHRKKYGSSIDDLATAEKLNEMASEIYAAYTEFLKKAKSKLHIAP